MDNGDRIAKQIVSFDGEFQLWVFDPSHGRLLLRRAGEKGKLKRVDIMFNDVIVIELSCFFDTIAIEEVERSSITQGLYAVKQSLEPGLKLFRIRTRYWVGYVVAAVVGWHEDDGGISDPSALYEAGPAIIGLTENSSWRKK